MLQRRTPADALVRQMQADPSVPGLLGYLDRIAEGEDAPQTTHQNLVCQAAL
jgi:hypothetical protein